MSQIRCLCRALFRRCANIYVLKLRFAVVWLGRIQNLDTRYADVLGLKSGSDRLSLSIYSITILLGVFFKSLYHSLSFLRCLSDSQLSSSPSCSFTRFSTQWSPQKCFPWTRVHRDVASWGHRLSPIIKSHLIAAGGPVPAAGVVAWGFAAAAATVIFPKKSVCKSFYAANRVVVWVPRNTGHQEAAPPDMTRQARCGTHLW